VCLHDVEHLLLDVVQDADLHCMEEDWTGEAAHNTVNMMIHGESSVDMAPQEFSIGCLGVGIAGHSI
jgi:hypothetical protein